jgi:modulator of FtsH protease
MIEQWSEFNVAMAGATAALAGLVIVAASVNIGEIVKSRTLTARLLAGIAALVLALTVSALGLVPRIDGVWLGTLTLVSALLASVFQIHATRLIARDTDPADRARPLKYLVGFLPIAAYLVAGVFVAFGHPVGLYLAAAGCLLAIVSAIVVSWVALVEVLR